MIKEFLSLYFTGLIYTNLFLIPVIIFYIYALYKKTSLSIILTAHKTILLITMILPLIIIVYSHTDSFVTKFTVHKQYTNNAISSSIPSNITRTISDLSVSNNSPIQYEFPITKDVLFYFADIILLLSFIGLFIFLMRFSIQFIQLAIIRKNRPKKY